MAQGAKGFDGEKSQKGAVQCYYCGRDIFFANPDNASEHKSDTLVFYTTGQKQGAVPQCMPCHGFHSRFGIDLGLGGETYLLNCCPLLYF